MFAFFDRENIAASEINPSSKKRSMIFARGVIWKAPRERWQRNPMLARMLLKNSDGWQRSRIILSRLSGPSGI